MSVQTLIQVRRGSASEWRNINPTLSAGEWGFETDTKRYKIGDGLTAWNSLAYSSILPSSSDLVGASGVAITFTANSGVPVTVAVTGISSSQVTNFNSAVSGLLPVKDVVAGTNIAVSSTDGVYTISTDGLDQSGVKDVVGETIVGVSGISATYDNLNKVVNVAVTGISSDYVTNFNTAVSGLVNGIYAPLTSPALSGTPTAPTAAADTNTTQIASTAFVLGQASSSTPLVDGTAAAGSSLKYARADHVHPTDTSRAALAGATFTGAVAIPNGTGNFASLTLNNVAVSVSGHQHTSSDVTDFNSSVSGLLNVKSLSAGSGIGIVNTNGVHAISVTGIPSSLITDLGNIATTQVIGRTGIALSYDSVTDTMYIDTTGVSLVGHTHVWSNITDASSRATLSELAYLSGVAAGTVSAGRVLVADSSKNLTGINNLTATGDVTVGGNLVVQGTTTTVNSTTVDIGDNIIKVNTSGLPTGGMEVYNGSTTYSIIWNNTNNRWEFTGGNVYTSGNFIGSLSGNASTVTNGVYTTDTGTVTSTMIANDTIVNADINSAAAISYSKLNLSNSITNADIASNAAIAVTKLASSGVTIGNTTVNLGSSTSILAGLTSISGTSTGSPTTLYNCVIDGGTP